MTPDKFVEAWAGITLNERASAQPHFEAVCRMVGHEVPHEKDPKGEFFAYEYGVQKSTGGQGFADVFYKGHFAIEYKGIGKYKDLNDAYQQLLRYRENLFNPPLLIVCDIANWEVHTNFPNTEKKVYRFTNADIPKPHIQRILHNLFFNPDALHPDRNTAQVTADAAKVFERIAENMRGWKSEPDRIAHFLTKLVFCLFAEDVTLLPAMPNTPKGIFSSIIEQTRTNPPQFKRYLGELFNAMADGGNVLMQTIPYFNGKLFEDVDVEELSLEALTELAKASQLDWSAIEPAIFGTLFERSLDPSKRAQLGAHYTSRDDILLIVEPVLMQPLRREWDAIKAEAVKLREEYDKAETPRVKLNRQSELLALREKMLARLRTVKVLDPACGSGNFLYVALNLLLDMEKAVMNDPLFAGMPLALPEVHPRQLYGIELEPIAHALASIVVWIGYIQWRQNNGYMAFKEPILEQIGDNIRRMDAILAYDADGKPIEPEWPDADVIVGNPPFLGSQRMRSELGDKYVDDLRKLYENRIGSSVDLVLYWFEKARTYIETHKIKRVGLLSTNSIRGGTNREVLKRIKETGDIFMAWSDREWILEGAAVRVSMTCFDNGEEKEKTLDGQPVSLINSDLTASVDITIARTLAENTKLAFQGPVKVGAFDIPNDLALSMLRNSDRNLEVIKPYLNGDDIVKRSRNYWLIDFSLKTIEEAATYSAPFEYTEQNVKPERLKNNDRQRRENWWRLGRSGEDYKQAIIPLTRQIFTPRVSKHRLFVWIDKNVMPSDALVAIAREDDYFFGVLHSKIHEVWSLRMGTWLGKGNDPRYTPTTTFETFPFPYPPGKEDTGAAAYQAISAAAKCLHDERAAWLNPEGMSEKALKDRTLTDLYNALNVFRGREKIKVKAAAGDFAPRLDDLHTALDRAVCDAYGWPHSVLADEEEILRRLLALNLERAGK